LITASNQYSSGRKAKLATILEAMRWLIDFYPKHIEKEDHHFFVEVMDYFSQKEQDKMLDEGHVFDRKMIHKQYDRLVSEFVKISSSSEI
jgi:hemerythrin-like domain-containing protein